MSSRKSLPAPEPDQIERKVPTNIGLEPKLKSDALEFVKHLGVSLSDYIAEMLEVQLIAAGRRKAKKPVIHPMPHLLTKKKL